MARFRTVQLQSVAPRQTEARVPAERDPMKTATLGGYKVAEAWGHHTRPCTCK